MQVKHYECVGAANLWELGKAIQELAKHGYVVEFYRVTAQGDELYHSAIMSCPSGEEDQPNEGRSENFRFSMVGIQKGETIVFKNDESKKAFVLDDKKIVFEGEEMTLTSAARKIRGGKYSTGTRWWTYNGETLDALRRRIT